MRWIVAAAIMLSASSANAGTFETLRAGLKSLEGQPLSHAIDKLGLPADKMEMGDLTVYAWVIGNVYAGLDDAELKCTVRAGVDGSNVVRKAEFHGNRGACESFAKKFKK